MMKQLLYLAIFLLISSDTVLATDPKYTVLSDEFTVNYFWGVGNPLIKRRVSCPEYHSDDIDKIKEEVVVELLEAAVPIPITVSMDAVKVIRRDNEEE